MLGGDEWMRTKYGNNNSYTIWSDNEWNWFRWGEWRSSDFRLRMHDFVRKLIQFRKDHAYAFAPKEYGSGMPLAWKTAGNQEFSGADWSGKVIMLHYYNDGTREEPEIIIMMNMNRDSQNFTLPQGRDWQMVMDTQAYYDTESYLAGTDDANVSWNISMETDISGTYNVQGSSIVIAVEKK